MWQRILTLHTGVGVVSMALIVASFMAGLGIGSELGGLLSARLGSRAALRGFALLELGVGAFAAVSCRLYHDGLGRYADGLYETTAGAALAHFLAFLLPTTLMGMSLPFLVRATVRETASASRVIGGLYGLNVLGAASGALLAPWVLVRFLGMEGAVRVGAVAEPDCRRRGARRGPPIRAGPRGARRAERRPARRARRARCGPGCCSTGSRASSRSRSRSPGSA